MFKFMIGARRRPGITRAQFSVHYQQIHGGKVLADPERYVERYVQNHVRDGANGQQADGSQLADLDAVSEIWFEDATAMQRGINTDHYKAVVQPDEQMFTDSGRIVIVACQEEHEVVAQPRNGLLKLMRFLRRREGVSREEFADAWRRETARLAADPELGTRIRRLTRNHALPGAAEEVQENFVLGTAINVYDGVESIWFDAPSELHWLERYREEGAREQSVLYGLQNHAADIHLIVEEREIIPVHGAISHQ